MSTETIAAAPPALPDAVHGKIRGLRRRVRQWFAFDGLARFFAAMLFLGALDMAIDWQFRMDKAQRGVMLALMIGALVWIAWRYLIRPLSAKMTDEALCLEVERRNKHVGEKLISALEFSRVDWKAHPNASPAFVRATIDQAAAEVDRLDFLRVTRGGRFGANFVFFSVFAGMALGLAAAIPSNRALATWFNRNVVLGDASWPQDFHMEIDGADGQTIIAPKGDEWSVVARVLDGYRYLPQEVKIELSGPEGSRVETMDRQTDGKVFRYRMAGLTESMRLRLTSSKNRTEWYQVRLVDRPTFDGMDLRVTPPEYTGVPIEVLPPGSGPYHVLKGSRLHLRGKASKPLSSALLVIGANRHPLPVSGQEFRGTIEAAKLVSGTYLVEIHDTEDWRVAGQDEAEPTGLSAKEPAKFKVKMVDDAAPRVTCVAQGISGMVTPNARIPYAGKIDDDYGLTDVALSWQWREDKSESSEEPQRSRVPGGIGEKIEDKSLEFQDALDLEPEKIPEGSRLSLTLSAQDNDTLGGPKLGESTKIVLRVVSEADLRADMLRREKEQREIFAEIVGRQDALYTDCQALTAETRDKESLTSDQRARLVESQKRQKLLGSNVAPLLKRLTDMVAEIANNRLEAEDGVIRRRLLTKIIQPMTATRDNDLAAATEMLDAARRAGAKDERAASLGDALTAQRDALTVMRQILAHMVKNEGYQQALNLLYDVQKSQEEVRRRTEAEKQDLLKKHLDPPAQNPAPPAPPKETPEPNKP